MMKLSEDIIPPILFFLLVVFIFGGFGYLIQSSESRQERLFNACLSAGNQYLNGDCIK